MRHAVVVERSFGEPARIAELARRQHEASAGAEVAWLHTLAARDARRAICVYAGPDTEAVVRQQERLGLRCDRAWSGALLRPFEAPVFPQGYSAVVVDREIGRDLTREQWLERARTGAWCMSAYRVSLFESVFAPEHGRALCVFIAPDVEAVRMANTPFSPEHLHVWPCAGFGAGAAGKLEAIPPPASA